MELRHLRYFIAVAEEGHITRAAERLDIQQPPLSRQIKAMERELDVQLFHRKARGVELTEADRALLDGARAMLGRLDHTLETTRRTARGEQGRICVGLTPTGPFHPFVPRVIRAFRDAYPLVSLTLEECLTNDLVERLRDEQIDAAFVRMPVGDREGVVVTPLLEEAMVVALPSGHALAKGTDGEEAALSFKALSSEAFIVYGPPPTGMYVSVTAACHAVGFTPRIGQEVPRITSALSFVAAGLGICVVPASVQRMNMDGVVYRRLKGAAQLTAPLSLVSRRGDPSPVVRHFLKLVRAAAKNFAAA